MYLQYAIPAEIDLNRLYGTPEINFMIGDKRYDFKS